MGLNIKDHLEIIWEDPSYEEGQWELKTSHPRITYDSLSEGFCVDLGEGTWAEVYGLHRAGRALEIAKHYDKKRYVEKTREQNYKASYKLD